MPAPGSANQLFCFANASRASTSCIQFDVYFCASSYFAIASLVRPCFKCLYDFVPHDCTFRVPSLLTRCLSLRLLWIVKRNFCGLGLANV
jgi:hypothetical protein